MDRTITRIAYTAFLVILISLLLISCRGGGSGDGSTTTAPPTQITDVVAAFVNDDRVAALAVNGEGESLSVLGSAVSGTATVTGAILTLANGESAVVYAGDDGLPAVAIVGDVVLVFSNYTENTVDVALIYSDGRSDIFERVALDQNALNQLKQLQSFRLVSGVSLVERRYASSLTLRNLPDAMKFGGWLIDTALCGAGLYGLIPSDGFALPLAALCISSLKTSILEISGSESKFADDLATGLGVWGCGVGVLFTECLPDILNAYAPVVDELDKLRAARQSEIDRAKEELTAIADNRPPVPAPQISSQLTVGPTSINFGSVQAGTCKTAFFSIQHIAGTAPASGSVSITPNSPFSIISGATFNASGYDGPLVEIRFCPSNAGTFSAAATVFSDATFTGTNIVTLTGTGSNSTPTTGTIQVAATLNGANWSGVVSYTLSGPTTFSGTTAYANFPNRSAGSWSLTYNSGGPPGATLFSITPSTTRTLSGGGSITFTLNFTLPASGGLLTVDPTSLNFGSVQAGTCKTAFFSIQHIAGTAPASGSVSITPNSPFSITSGATFNTFSRDGPLVEIRFCPSNAGTFSAAATVSSDATFTGTNIVTLTGTGSNSTPTTGTIQVAVTLDGANWSGGISYTLSGRTTFSGTTAYASFPNRSPGSWSLTYNSGGPPGATLFSITPFTVQTLSGGGSTTFTLNFTSPGSGALLTVGPTSLNFGSIQAGTCKTAFFVIQHIVGTMLASGSVSITPNSPFSVISGGTFSASDYDGSLVGIRFCPSNTWTYSAAATVSSVATFIDTNIVTLTGMGN